LPQINQNMRRVLTVLLFLAVIVGEASAQYQNTILCNDSDLGKDYYVRGGITRNGRVVWTDNCLNPSQLLEGYCPDSRARGYYRAEAYMCPKGCFNGVCRPLKPVLYLSKATTTTIWATTTTSTTTTTTVRVTATTLGKCIDSDGGKDYSVQGTSNGGNGKFSDVCMSPTILKERYCGGGVVRTEVYACDFGCTRGRCREENTKAYEKSRQGLE